MRTIRRTDREITAQEAAALLERAEYGVLSTVGVDGQPYGMPLSFVYRDGGIYFHCALNGHKLDNIAHNDKVSFCAVGATRVLPDKFATEYESAVAFGVVSELTGAERLEALFWLVEKYSPGFLEEGKRYIEQKEQATKVFKIEVSHYTGKARR
jgi:uncharacterized protein